MSPARWMLIANVLVGWLGIAQTPLGAATPRVNDEGKFFSPAAVEKANLRIAEIRRDFKLDLLIDTVPGVPADMQDQLKQMQAKSDKQGRSQFFRDWTVKRAKDAVVKGIYCLICKDPPHLQIDVDNATRAKAFTPQDRDQLTKKMSVLLGKENDAALAQGVDFVQSTLRANLGRRAETGGVTVAPPVAPGGPRPPAAKPAAEHPPAQAGETPWLRWVFIGLAVLVGIWVLRALMHGLAGAGGGGAGRGYGGGGGGGYGGGGGGGGGFLSGMLGGMFGAAAGNWLYDSFARGGHARDSSQAFGGQGENRAAPRDEPGAGDFSGDAGSGADFGGDDTHGGDTGGDTGGADFGGGDTGGDTGGADFGGGDTGGGDFGGGADFGGGGDLGGGGDFGGGGDG